MRADNLRSVPRYKYPALGETTVQDVRTYMQEKPKGVALGPTTSSSPGYAWPSWVAQTGAPHRTERRVRGASTVGVVCVRTRDGLYEDVGLTGHPEPKTFGAVYRTAADGRIRRGGGVALGTKRKRFPIVSSCSSLFLKMSFCESRSCTANPETVRPKKFAK